MCKKMKLEHFLTPYIKGGEKSGRGFKMGGHMYTCGQFMLIYGKNCHNTVIILQLKINFKKERDRKNPPANAGVQSLVQEDPTCRGATKSIHHNYSICALEPMLHNKRSHHNEKPMHHNKEWTLIFSTREKPTQQ